MVRDAEGNTVPCGTSPAESATFGPSDAPVTDEEQAEVSAHLASVIQGLIEASAGHRSVHARPRAKCRRCAAILAGMQLLDDLESDGPPPTNGGGEEPPQLVEYEKRAAG